jgi:hypothetical protein
MVKACTYRVRASRTSPAALISFSAPPGGCRSAHRIPITLSHLEEALERLSTGAVKLAQAVEDWNGEPDALPPEARALRWHLFHLASRLRGAQEACPETRRWAREVVPQDAASP